MLECNHKMCKYNTYKTGCNKPSMAKCPLDKPRIETNADRIRGMSDEELAVFLEQTQADVAFNNKSKYTFEWGKWLKQPAEG